MANVCALWRYPIKSMGGERLEIANLDHRGVVGDRLYAVITPDGKLGSGKNTRRFGRIDGLLGCAAHLDDGGIPMVALPDGKCVRADDPTAADVLGNFLGTRVSLAREGDTSHFDAAPIHLVTTSSLAWLRQARPETPIDERRLRPNIVLDTGELPPHIEEQWIGRTLAVGSARLRIRERTERCVMVTATQPDLPADPAILRTLVTENAGCIGVYADIVTAGTIHLSDPAR